MYHYVYRITNKLLNKHYYGKRSSKVDPRQDLGICYFSSSKDRYFMEDQKQNPQNYEYTIVAVCDNSLEALELEIYLHDYFDVGNNERFFNKAKQTSVGWDTTGITLTEEHKKKVSDSLKGRVFSEETRKKMGQAQKGNKKGLGNKLSKEHIAKLIECNKTRVWTEEMRKKASKSHAGHNAGNAMPVNIYDYHTNELVAENVIIGVWVKGKGLHAASLRATINRDLSRPSCKNPKNKQKYNLHEYKGLYAVRLLLEVPL